MLGTQNEFFTAMRRELTARYEWARKPESLERFMRAVVATVAHGENKWNHNGKAVTAAWRAIGGKGKPTKKALRALTKGDN